MKLEDIGFYTLSEKRACDVMRKVGAWHTYHRCEIIVTNKCNFNCPYCRGVDSKELSYEEVERIIKKLQRITAIRFSGGEPTQYPHIAKCVSFAKSFGIDRIAISTNGSAPIEVYKMLVDLGVNDFSISLDACCAADGEMMAGGVENVWDRVVNNIRELSKITYVTVGIVITEDNIDKANEVIKFAHELCVSDIRVIPSAQYNKMISVLGDINPEYYKNRPILKYRVFNAKRNRHTRGLEEYDSHKCPLVLDDIAISGDNHYPCIIYMREKGEPIGKITDNIEDIRDSRLQWFKNANTHCDPICKKNCLDVCIEYNNRCEQYEVSKT